MLDPQTPSDEPLPGKNPARGGQARGFWIVSFLVALGFIAVFGLMMLGAAWMFN